MEKRKIIVAITGASGSVYGFRLLEKLKQIDIAPENICVILSDQGKLVLKFELGDEFYSAIPFTILPNDSYWEGCASGSSGYDTMIIAPCSMGTLGRIAGGISSDLISRSADVILKERKKLILLTRETPVSLIHLKNMLTLTEAGGIICPASPSFYSRPKDMDELIDTVVDRILSLADIPNNRYQWGS